VAVTALSAWAKDVYSGGTICDAETGKRIWGSTITVINEATGKTLSTQVDAAPENIIMEPNRFYSVKFWVPNNDTINLRYRITHPEYKTDSVSFQFPRDFNGYQVHDTIWLVANDCELDAKTLINLREVTVTATKVKMVMNGDTIVYNADAFNLPEGSLLDALVRQLPGVTLNSQGQIRVNGEYVSSLLIDGKKFFQGDPTVALNNLPAYTVKNVQVYRHDEYKLTQNLTEAERLALPLVMDVKLKPQYQKGAFGNISVGYGTSGRYLARAFGMEYVRNFSVVAYGQANNINSDASGPTSYGASSWNESNSYEGSRQIVKAGLNCDWSVSYENETRPYLGSKTYRIESYLTYSHSKNSVINRTAATSFMPDGDIYSRTNNATRSRSDRAKLYLRGLLQSIPLDAHTVVSLFPRVEFAFNKVDNTVAQQAAEFDYEPLGSITAVLDSTFTAADGTTGTAHRAIYHSPYEANGLTRTYDASASFYVAPNRVDSTGRYYKNLRNKFSIDWSFSNTHGRTNSDRRIYYNTLDTAITRMLNKSFSGNWTLGLNIEQEVRCIDVGSAQLRMSITESYKFIRSHGYQKVHQTDNPYASLEEAATDAANTYFSNETTNRGDIDADFTLSKDDSFVDLRLRGAAIHTHLLYQRGDIDADVSRLRWKFEPSLSAKYAFDTSKANHGISLSANLQRILPTLTTLLPTTNSTNPLAIYLGNPNLKNGTNLNAELKYERQVAETGFYGKVGVGHNRYWNRRSTRRTYDSTTGVSTYTPVNVNGAYDINGNIYITAKLDHDNRLWLTSSTSATYEHIPDWMQENGGSDVMSTVRNTLLSQRFQLNWSIASGYSMNFGIKGTWRNATSPMASFTTINAADIATKLAAQIQLPWKLQLGTDMTLYKRCGYGDASLNDASWVWNAKLSRTFLADRLTASINAFDILGQLSNVSATINSLGRTETWTNSLRRYAMLTLTYRFSLMPRTAGSN
jgi:hypothetical protein